MCRCKPPALTTLCFCQVDKKPQIRADLLGSAAINQLLEKLLAQADIIIFNAPPINAVSDATVLGSRLDGVLLVINSGITSRDQAAQAKDTLETANVRIIGATLINAATEVGFGEY